MDTLKVTEFILFKYDKSYWIGMLNEIDIAEQDVMVKFMHLHCPFIKHFWPSSDMLLFKLIISKNIKNIQNNISKISQK